MSAEHRRNPDTEENHRQTRENDAAVKTVQFLHDNPKPCRGCGSPIPIDAEFCADCLNNQQEL